jgi:hypothetical protein
VQLQGELTGIRDHGLGLAAISYDSPDTLKKFANSRGITFPLISDRGSEIIKRYGILNTQQQPGGRAFGVPYPGTFLVDRKGVVTARFFEDAYQERYTAATMLASQGATAAGAAVVARTPHITVHAAPTATVVAPGHRITIIVDVTPAPGIHVYAPGRHSYQVVRFEVDPAPSIRVHDVRYPPSDIYDFAPLNERVEVYSKPFQLRRDVTVLATPEVQKALAEAPTLTITGALEYQACDDKICYNPTRVPMSFTLSTKALDRRPPDK